jgi:hypothetical protein
MPRTRSRASGILRAMRRGTAARVSGLVVSVVLIAACAAESSTPAPTGAATTPAPTVARTPAPTPPDDVLPPGVEFGASTVIPGWAVGLRHEIRGEPLFFAARDGRPVAIRRSGDEWRIDVIDDEAGLELPAGMRRLGAGGRESLGLLPTTVATGTAGTVVGGIGYAGDGGGSRVAVGLLWHSPDGEAWGRFDPRTVLGGRDTSVAVRAVTATATGYLAAASIASLGNGASPGSRIAVLRSTDGRSWSLVSTLDDRWPLGVEALHAWGERVVLVGFAAVCNRRLGPNDDSALARSARVWQSIDGGTTWAPVDLTGAATVLEPGEPVPDAATCPDPGADPIGFQQRFGTRGTFAGGVDGRLVILSRDGSATASSDEAMTSWVIAPVPGGSATAGPDGGAPRPAAAILLTSDTTGWILRSLQPRRDAAGTQLAFGCDVRWWRSDDAGATWVPGIAGRPLKACSGGLFSFHAHADGSVTLLLRDAPVNPNPGAAYRTSTGGPVSAWGTCDPGPEADCAFATLEAPGGDAPVAWPGIDLAGASVTNARFAGADLTGAHLGGAVIEGDLRGARLGGAYLGYATITGNLAGADLTDALLFRTVLGGDLTGMRLDVADNPAGVTFLPGTICPDGAPAGAGAGGAACRLP